jgi:hypothetical protein
MFEMPKAAFSTVTRIDGGFEETLCDLPPSVHGVATET